MALLELLLGLLKVKRLVGLVGRERVPIFERMRLEAIIGALLISMQKIVFKSIKDILWAKSNT